MRTAGVVLGVALVWGLLAAGAPPAPAEEAGRGCIVVESIETEEGTCRTRVRNVCAGALRVTVAYEVDLWRFVAHEIPPRPPGAGHEGEPAAGHYVSAGVHSGEQTGLLAGGETGTFAYQADGADSLIVDCRVRVRGTPAS